MLYQLATARTQSALLVPATTTTTVPAHTIGRETQDHQREDTLNNSERKDKTHLVGIRYRFVEVES